MNSGLLNSFLASAAACAIMACAYGGQTKQCKEGTAEAAPTSQGPSANEVTTEVAPTEQGPGTANEVTTEAAPTEQGFGAVNPAAVGPAVTISGNCWSSLPAGSSCPEGSVCLYQNSNRSGFGLRVPNGCEIRNMLDVVCLPCMNSTHDHHQDDHLFNDQMSSWENRSGQDYCWYYDVGYSGIKRTMKNGMILEHLGGDNDRASSIRPCGQ